MNNDLNENYDKEFFDTGAGTRELGLDITYNFEQVYPGFKILAHSLKEQFNPNRVLDVGCAMGFLVKALQSLGIESWGLDISKYAISCAPLDIRSHLRQIDLTKDKLPFADQYFDLITFLGTIEYLPDHKQAITEIHRVLRDKGLLYIQSLRRELPNDKLRTNVHAKKFWVAELESRGFSFAPMTLRTFLKNQFGQTLLTSKTNTIKNRLAKLVYRRGGFIGRHFIFLVGQSVSHMNRELQHLLFIKE